MKFQKTYLLELPIETVYSGWISEHYIVPPATKLEIQPYKDGIYRLTSLGNSIMEGTFEEVQHNKYLKYSWQWLGSDETTKVEVSFRPHSGGTELVIVHSGFDSEESLHNYADGWDSYVVGLMKLLEKGS